MVEKAKKSYKKVVGFLITALSLCLMTGTALADELPIANLQPVKDALTSAFTTNEIAAVIGIIIGTGVGFVLLWWGARKLVHAIINAFKSGKLRF